MLRCLYCTEHGGCALWIGAGWIQFVTFPAEPSCLQHGLGGYVPRSTYIYQDHLSPRNPYMKNKQAISNPRTKLTTTTEPLSTPHQRPHRPNNLHLTASKPQHPRTGRRNPQNPNTTPLALRQAIPRHQIRLLRRLHLPLLRTLPIRSVRTRPTSPHRRLLLQGKTLLGF